MNRSIKIYVFIDIFSLPKFGIGKYVIQIVGQKKFSKLGYFLAVTRW